MTAGEEFGEFISGDATHFSSLLPQSDRSELLQLRGKSQTYTHVSNEIQNSN
jgi:hypothetical protein